MTINSGRSPSAFFTLADLHGALPEIGPGAFKTLLSRAEKRGLLQRVCRGLYFTAGK